MARLEGRTALVTGASRGLGRAIALKLAEDGARVALNYRCGEEQAREVADQIRSCGGTALILRADVSVKDEARSLVGNVLEQWGQLDVLVNNAGITRDRSMRKLTDDDWTEVINTNLNSVYYCTSAALKPMIERKYGRVVNISSFVGQAGNFGQANYSASKGGVIAFTKSPMGRFGKPEDIARAVAFLCAEGDYITGQQINVNGGVYM